MYRSRLLRKYPNRPQDHSHKHEAVDKTRGMQQAWLAARPFSCPFAQGKICSEIFLQQREARRQGDGKMLDIVQVVAF